MKNKYLLIAFTVLTITACKRKGMVDGKVTNVFDGKPVEGISVKIKYSSDGDINKAKGELTPVTTNANGEFNINATYNTRVSYDYYIALNPNENYVSTDQFYVKDTTSQVAKTYFYFTSQYSGLLQDIKPVKKSKDKQTFEFNVAPCARLKITTKNLSPVNDSDRIVVTLLNKSLKDGVEHLFTGKKSTGSAGNYSLVPTSGEVRLQWVALRGTQQTVGIDTIQLAPHTKKIYHISY